MTEATPATTDKKDVVPSQYRDKYKATGGTCGDFIAKKLSEVGNDGVEALTSVKRENGIPADRWATFNPGMQRMNLANVLRANFLNGETISILGKQYNVRHQLEDFNGEVKDDDKTLEKIASYLELQVNDRMVAALRKLLFSPPKKTAEEREAERAAKAEAKAAEKAEKQKGRDLEKAQKALTKATDAKTATAAAVTEADAALNEAIAAANAADDEGKAKAQKAVEAAQRKVDKAQEKDDKAQAKVDEAEAAIKALEDA